MNLRYEDSFGWLVLKVTVVEVIFKTQFFLKVDLDIFIFFSIKIRVQTPLQD